MFDAPLQLRGFLLQSSQLLYTFVLWLSACWYLRCYDSVPSQYKSFERSHYIQWNLYDNCAAGNINYTFRRFDVSSHHLLGACIRLDKMSLGPAAPYMRNLISLQLLCIKEVDVDMVCHYLCSTWCAQERFLLNLHAAQYMSGFLVACLRL